MNKYLSITLLTFTLTACSNEVLYQVGQDYQKSECIKNAASESQHRECLEKEQKPFEEYEKERKVIIKK